MGNYSMYVVQQTPLFPKHYLLGKSLYLSKPRFTQLHNKDDNTGPAFVMGLEAQMTLII